MQQTPLYDTHVAMNGRMVEFAGWALPVQYPPGPTLEHQAVRNAAGLFDIDHMGQFELRGPDAALFLQYIQVWDIERMQVDEAHYSLLLYGDGTLVDDIFLYRRPDRWLIVVNAGNRSKDLAWMQANTLGFDVTLSDVSETTCMLALQGPKAEQILQHLTNAPLSQVATRTCLATQVAGVDTLIGRTGYTGEDGFELYLPASAAVDFWQTLLETGKADGLLACGLAARDSLRFEACMPLYGHELDAQTNPLEARLGWTISWHKEFVGREALLKVKMEKPQRLLIGFEMLDKAVAREHYDIAVNNQVIGHVTSGMKSPTLDKFLGLGYVPSEYSTIGAEIDILVRGQPKKAKVVKRPFYQPRYK
ncbi:MAG: glycine cleavage system aminomethyltransferase GcvT [Chloroflexi bacterium]|nr:glycine cleavage system aminomethyltransferase GcvT [Chloroflexota bacterium]